MDELLSRFWREIVERPSGPFAFRFYLQPLMACVFAIKDGIMDARTGRPAYFWALFTDRHGRRERLRGGWRSIKRVFLLAVAIDLVYQLVVLKGVRPLETLLVAATLAIVPYVLLRGPTTRILRRIGRGARPAAPRGHAA